jgi:hypothetical protein
VTKGILLRSSRIGVGGVLAVITRADPRKPATRDQTAPNRFGGGLVTVFVLSRLVVKSVGSSG